jgi:hypothetical protein
MHRERDTRETSRKIRELEHVSRKARVQSARVLEVPIPELSDRGIRTGVADPRIDGPALTGFRLLLLPCSGANSQSASHRACCPLLMAPERCDSATSRSIGAPSGSLSCWLSHQRSLLRGIAGCGPLHAGLVVNADRSAHLSLHQCDRISNRSPFLFW